MATAKKAAKKKAAPKKAAPKKIAPPKPAPKKAVKKPVKKAPVKKEESMPAPEPMVFIPVMEVVETSYEVRSSPEEETSSSTEMGTSE